MYRVVCGIISRRNTIICKQRGNVGDITKRLYTGVQCNKCATASRSFHTTSIYATLPLWMLLTSQPLLLSIVAGSCLKWLWRDIPTSTPSEVLELIITKKRLFMNASLMISSAALLIYISGLQKDPISKRRRFIALNKKQMNQLAELQLQEMAFYMTQSLPQSDSRYTRLRKVMKRLLKANQDLESVREKDWDVFLIDAPHYTNAMAIHKGKVFVFSGMLQMCTTDDQLGFVLAHEMSHVLLLHMPERFSKMHLTDLFLLIPLILVWATMSFRGALISHYMVMYLSELFVHLPAKRKLEYEADSVGLELAAKACFDIRDASVFWHKIELLLWVNDGKPVEWISTHPGSRARRKSLDKQMPHVILIRKERKCPKLPATDPRVSFSESHAA